MLSPFQLGPLLNFKTHREKCSLQYTIHSLISAHKNMPATIMWPEAQSPGREKTSSAIPLAGMWKAPLGSYGALWEFIGGIYHINFLVRRSQWAQWAAVLGSAGVGEGRKSRITVVRCSRYCTQNFTKDWSCQTLRASVPAFKDVPLGLDAAQRPMLGCRTYLREKAVTSELAIFTLSRP